MLRERAARRVQLLPAYEETADEIAERSAEHQTLFELQWRSNAWSSDGPQAIAASNPLTCDDEPEG
jgi:hypothetical protein